MTVRNLTALSALMGNKIYNHLGEPLGIVKDLLVDIDASHIKYVLLSFGGFLGFGTKLIVIPFSLIKLDDNHQLKINIDRSILNKAPIFCDHLGPHCTDAEWAEKIANFYTHS